MTLYQGWTPEDNWFQSFERTRVRALAHEMAKDARVGLAEVADKLSDQNFFAIRKHAYQDWLARINSPEMIAMRGGTIYTPHGWR